MNDAIENLLAPRIEKNCMSLFNDGHFRHSAREAMVQVEIALKEKGKVEDVEFGVQLIGNLFAGKGGVRLRVPLGNELQIHAEKYFKGVFSYYRNYVAHDGSKIDEKLALRILIIASDLLELIDASELTKGMQRRLKQVLRKTVNDVMRETAPQLWASLPIQAKNLIYARIEADIPNVVHNMVDDFKHNVEEIIDVTELVVTKLMESPEIINEIFLKSGEKEFPFVEHSGFIFGLLFGFPTMFVWMHFPEWWILPLGGLIVGYLTNWLALKVIFEPKHPTKILGLTIQGMFLKRQNEVSDVYSAIIEAKLMTSENDKGNIWKSTISAVPRRPGNRILASCIKLRSEPVTTRITSSSIPASAMYFTALSQSGI